ncbi:MAG: hypothetical protein RLZZ350_1673 [Verrucomicrobiota bacterium]
MPEVIATETFFDLPFPRHTVWPVFGNTDWLNRALGLPGVNYRTEPLPEGGTAVWATARVAGAELKWREWPFEWREPEFHIVRREFLSGPWREFLGGVDFLELPNGGTRLRVHSRMTPRHALGQLLTKTIIVPQTNRAMTRAVAHAREFLAGNARLPLPHLPVSFVDKTVLRDRTEALQRSGGDPALAMRLADWLTHAADVELTHLRPRELARRWGVDVWELLRLLLFAAHSGLLQFRWEILCPNCRSSRAPLTTSLAGLKRTAHCDVCDIKFDGEFDQSVELKFTVHPAVRKVEPQTFCLAGPSGKPHVLQQLFLQPGEIRVWGWPANSGGLRLRSPQVRSQWLCEDVGAQTDGLIVCAPENFIRQPAANANEWKISNPNKFPVQVALERVAWSDDILTAAAVTNWQVFRDLFDAEVLAADESVMVSEQAVLFTDLRGSTAMYHALGDARAYTQVRGHFDVLSAAVSAHHGGIVKTIGDAVMAVFSNCRDACAAAQAMFKGIAEANAHARNATQLVLKAGLHIGPCLAVNANDKLDYFGTTVNLAGRLTGFSRGGELAVSDEVFKRADFRAQLGDYATTAAANQFTPRGFEKPVLVWLVPL